MTTIIGICCKDGIVMGSDTKEVSGTMKMSRKEKIYSHNLGNHPVLIATAGEVETIKQAVTRIDPSQMDLGEEHQLFQSQKPGQNSFPVLTQEFKR
ncbi:hypothetical protein CW714_09110 [Methanophagales archaeon]|nr:MAG: hypothetical protein CW714_09110 [Methanophagales archaeon]